MVLAALVLSACDDDVLPAVDLSVPKTTFRYVTETVTLPTGELEYTFDPIGDGVKRNRLGAMVGALNFSGVKVQETEDEAIARGEGLNLLAVSTGDPDLREDTGARTDFLAASPMALPADGGVGTWTVDPAIAGATFTGPLAGGVFQSADPKTLKSPPTFYFKFSISGAEPVTLPVFGARLSFSLGPDRLVDGRLQGGIKKTDVDTLLIPSIALRMTEALHKMPCEAKCLKDNEDISNRFDTGGCGSAVAKDLTIDACEVANNALVRNLIAAEVQLFDGAGAWAPNRANTTPDSLSMAVAFTATRAEFAP
jgi:hypothetical protein